MRIQYGMNILGAALACVTLIGCDSSNASQEGDELGVPLVYEILVDDDFISTGQMQTRKFELIQDQQTFDNRLFEFGVDSSGVEAVDFTSSQIALISMGTRPTGGYNVRVTSVREFSEYAEISTTYKLPGRNCVFTQTLTNPFVFVEVPSLTELLVNESISIEDC